MSLHFLNSPALNELNGLKSFAKSDFDAFDRDVLTVARHLFECHQYPEPQAWKFAFRHAELAFPPPFGATIAHAVSAMVDALSAVRSRTFAYLPVHHLQAGEAMTQEENYLLLTLHDIRTHRATRARTHAMLLCEGGDCDRLLFVARSIAIITGEVDA